MNLEETLDLVVMTKVLPKIHGSRQRLEDPLQVVHAWAEGNLPEAPRLPRTASKLEHMRAVLGDAQFVTFTE
jgi:5-methylcytosine-specific restriction protein B